MASSSPTFTPSPRLTAPTHPIARLPEEWSAVLEEWGEPRYRGQQVFEWIHKRGVFDPEQMKNLPKSLRARLVEEGLSLPVSPIVGKPSADGTRKVLLTLEGGLDVETVLIPELVREGEEEELEEGWEPKKRVVTQCISSQVGCAMGCVFCASGVLGLKKNLSAAEIIGQALAGRAALPDDQRLRNVVLMGMGEPLANYDAVARALVLLTHPDGLNLSWRRVTLSTSGLAPELDKLGRDFGGKVQLAISLHAVDDKRRSALMPINRKHNLVSLVAALKRYPLPKRRRITIEYTLMEGVNDSLADARGLVKLLEGVPIKVNLIPMNRVDGSELRAPSAEVVGRFRDELFNEGVPAFVRTQRGDSLAAACGQLALQGDGRKVKRRPLPRA